MYPLEVVAMKYKTVHVSVQVNLNDRLLLISVVGGNCLLSWPDAEM